MAAATLGQDMGWRSVAEAMRPIRDRAVASLSSAEGPVTKQMVTEACDTLIREKHRPHHLSGLRTPGLRFMVTKVGGERPKSSRSLLPLDGRRHHHQGQRKAGPRQERSRGRSTPCGVQALSSGRKKTSALHARTSETKGSGSDGSDGPEDKQGRREERHHPVARPTSDQEEDCGDEEGLRPEQKQAMGTEPSTDVALAILNGLDISSLPASTMVSIPWLPARMKQATPLPLCRMDADVVDSGDAGCEVTLSAD